MAHQTLLLGDRHIERLIDLTSTIGVVEAAFRAMARGHAVMPPKVYLPLPKESDFRAMPAFLAHPAACGVKWVNVHPHNHQRGLPTVMALIVLNDPATGMPLAVMDGVVITKLRTAAAAAVAARALARQESHAVGVIGCGAQADAQLLALAHVRRIASVKVWGYLPGEAARFCAMMRRRLSRVHFQPCARIREAAHDVDVLVTLTPSRRPLVQRSWVSPGTHINAVGADAPGKQELDPRILRDALVVVDEREQAIHGGELNVPMRRGQFRPSHIHASLGDILIGRRRGRRSSSDITVFDSTGLAIHDIAVAAEVFRRAQRRGLGRRITLCATS